jgi:hypothetical protein
VPLDAHPGAAAPFTAREPTTVRFTGTGTSDSVGICSGSLLVTNLKLNVTMTYTGAVTGTTLVEHQIWSAPITTFPARDRVPGHGRRRPPAIGAGLAITHIFLQCGNGGNSPSANFVWGESP